MHRNVTFKIRTSKLGREQLVNGRSVVMKSNKQLWNQVKDRETAPVRSDPK